MKFLLKIKKYEIGWILNKVPEYYYQCDVVITDLVLIYNQCTTEFVYVIIKDVELNRLIRLIDLYHILPLRERFELKSNYHKVKNISVLRKKWLEKRKNMVYYK